MFSILQEKFAAALLDANQPVPQAVTSYTARTPQKRFAVYRNNVVVGLVAAMKKSFPAINEIVGEEFFVAMARIFVVENPPRSPVLLAYGENFPDFISTFAPAADFPYLADVARLEVARTRAYHSADAAVLDHSHWAGLDTQVLDRVRITLHPSAFILHSQHPIVTIWAMNSGEAELRPINDWRAEDAVVLRPDADVQVRRLPAGGAAFLTALAANASLSEAAASGAADNPEFDLAANLAGLIGARLAIEISYAPRHKDIAA
jgi:hypothetical protein